MQKKENQKYQESIKELEATLAKNEADEQLDLDKIAEEQDTVSKKTKGTMHGTTVQGRSSTESFLPMCQQTGPLFYEPVRKQETEEDKVTRYERVIDTLRKQMENERRLLKQARIQLNRDMSSKTELEILLKQAVDKVISERKAHKKQA